MEGLVTALLRKKQTPVRELELDRYHEVKAFTVTLKSQMPDPILRYHCIASATRLPPTVTSNERPAGSASDSSQDAWRGLRSLRHSGNCA